MRVTVLGSGAWGSALAGVASRSGGPVSLWGRDPARLVSDDAIHHTADLAAAVGPADCILAAVPAQAVRAVLQAAAPHLRPGAPVVICAKGIERSTGLFMSDVVRQCLPGHPAAALSGPSFAEDVARGLPTAVTIAAESLEVAARLGVRLGSAAFRLYHSDDLRGVEVGGAAKNVLAIACGIADGRGLGASAAAALIARAFAELSRFGQRVGGRPETLAGLSGLGDLVLTCGSTQSRNFCYGQKLGRGEPIPDPASGPVVEGVWTAGVLARLARELGVDMPISTSVAAVLAGRLEVERAIEALLSRPFRAE